LENYQLVFNSSILFSNISPSSRDGKKKCICGYPYIKSPMFWWIYNVVKVWNKWTLCILFWFEVLLLIGSEILGNYKENTICGYQQTFADTLKFPGYPFSGYPHEYGADICIILYVYVSMDTIREDQFI